MSSSAETIIPLRVAVKIDEKIDDGKKYAGNFQYNNFGDTAEIHPISYIIMK